MSSPGTRITEFVLVKLADEPIAARAALYRDLSELAATSADRKRFEQLAADCDAIANSHEQLVLDFKRRARR